LAQRCVAGEFEGVAYRAAQLPEAVELDLNHQLIQYHMDKVDPVAAAARVAERARFENDKSEAEMRGAEVHVVAVERGGGRSARTLLKELQHRAESKSKKRSREGAEELHVALWPFHIQPGRPRRK